MSTLPGFVVLGIGLRHDDRVVALGKALRDRRAAIAACTAAGVFPLAHWLMADLSRGETSQQVGGILLYVELGGPLLAVTWAGAAVLCGRRVQAHA